jgi:hypothetical protein
MRWIAGAQQHTKSLGWIATVIDTEARDAGLPWFLDEMGRPCTAEFLAARYPTSDAALLVARMWVQAEMQAGAEQMKGMPPERTVADEADEMFGRLIHLLDTTLTEVRRARAAAKKLAARGGVPGKGAPREGGVVVEAEEGGAVNR